MPKSKCEKQLETMTEERNHWKRLAQEKADKVSQLERQLERNSIYAHAFTDGFKSIDKEIDRLQRERDITQAESEIRRRIFEQLIPHEIITNDDINPDTVHIGISVLFRYGIDPKDWNGKVFYAEFHGDLDSAIHEVLPPVILAAKRVPLPSDIAGSLDGISEADLLQLLHDLAVYRYGIPEGYNQKRHETFENLAAQMMESGFYTDRNHARTRFNQVIDRTFNNAEKRHKATVKLLNAGDS